MDACPCGDGRTLTDCCLPLIEAERIADSPEELMRSRYTAYVRGDIDYLLDTVHPERIDDHDPKSMQRWSAESEWEGLEILRSEQSEGDEGTVEFIARYRTARGEHVAHHELASFRRHGDRWTFVDGEAVSSGTIARENPKVGRNYPCPCNSGKKYKKCCGAA